MEINKQLQTLAGTKTFLKGISDKCRKNIIAAMKERNYENLLNKPNMTPKDKMGMQASIDLLVEKNMDTPKNIKRFEAIIYTDKHIEIGRVRRPRKDIKAKPNGNKIYQHGNTTYFKRSTDMVKEQNKILAKQGMRIPLETNYESSLRALPGEYDEREYLKTGDWYVGGNILALITGMSKSGHCNSNGELECKNEIGYRGAVASRGTGEERFFGFEGDTGMLACSSFPSAIPIRPIFK